MGTDDENLDRLQEELVVVGDLPEEHQAVIAGLTPEELEVISAVNKRFREADRVHRVLDPEDGFAGFWDWVHF